MVYNEPSLTTVPSTQFEQLFSVLTSILFFFKCSYISRSVPDLESLNSSRFHYSFPLILSLAEKNHIVDRRKPLHIVESSSLRLKL